MRSSSDGDLRKARAPAVSVGGALKDGVIELQGDHRDAVLQVLRRRRRRVLAGG